MHNEHTEAVARMQRFIHKHIHELITMRDLAIVSNYSLWYSAKMFKEQTGKSPFAYIRELRLTQAALQLRDTNESILDTALDFHFDSHEGFTRAFSKTFGVTPKKYQNTAPPIRLFYPYVVSTNSKYIEKRSETEMTKSNTIFTQVIKKPKRKLIFLPGVKAKDYFAYCEEVGCDVWGELLSFKGTLTEPAGYWLPTNMQDHSSQYVQGVEVPLDYVGTIPNSYREIILEEGYYMIFQGEPYEEDESTFMDKIRELQTAIKTFNPEMYGYRFDDKMPRFQLEPLGERGYMEGIPVKAYVKGIFTK